MADLSEVYAERNAVVLAFAVAMEMHGYHVGKAVDPAEPDWPVLLIDTPAGQVSWHFQSHEMPPGMPDYQRAWDGHDTPEKYDRIRSMVDGQFGAARPTADPEDPPISHSSQSAASAQINQPEESAR